jgi:hypothetical protein
MNSYSKLLFAWTATFTSWYLNATFHSVLVDLSLLFAILASAATFALHLKQFLNSNKNKNDN